MHRTGGKFVSLFFRDSKRRFAFCNSSPQIADSPAVSFKAENAFNLAVQFIGDGTPLCAFLNGLNSGWAVQYFHQRSSH